MKTKVDGQSKLPRGATRFFQSGFTLVELLVLLAIIGVLLSLLLPAVVSAREAARRLACLSNVRQVVLALHNYHSTYSSFPPQRVATPATSWVILTLPYFEQQNLYDEYDRKLAWNHPNNQPMVRSQLTLFRCPSAPHLVQRLDRISATLEAAAGDYAPPTAIAQGTVDAGYVSPRGSLTGLLNGTTGLSYRDALDGTSNTLMITEDSGRPFFYAGRRRGPDENVPGNGNLPVSNGRVRGAGWADPSNTIPLHGFTRDGLKSPGPCPINCTNNNEAYSFHVGGVNTGFADGSTRFIQDSIPIDLYASMITAQAGDLVSE